MMSSILFQPPNNVKGERKWGENIAPMKNRVNICEGLSWDKKGYTIEPFLDSNSYQDFKNKVSTFFTDILLKIGIDVPKNFSFENYHTLIGDKHLDFVNEVKHIPSELFPIDLKIIENRISEICNKTLSNFNVTTKESVFHFRVIRPGVQDFNPIHRDTWHWEYRDNINIYVGLWGSNEYSSLPLVEGSHYWNEDLLERTSGGAMYNEIQYVVPTITQSKKEIQIIRPNPTENEIMVFSPYLIHGGASNLNTNKTRISLEMRFWKK